ncbi:tetratricopeptide repeat protein [Caballeronia udeis]|uniref:tetratricopeptide repeat protein n=1 Tax=Caballeronia udeis TaxID=1232866 RepID=UPI0018D2E9F8|nr:tetratricopeptide repeat protein [Caballeronia udeis]
MNVLVGAVLAGGVSMLANEAPDLFKNTHVLSGTIVAVLMLGMLSWVARNHSLSYRIEQEFVLFKTSEELKPEDFKFCVIGTGKRVLNPRTQHRPYFPNIYIQRQAVSYQDRFREPPEQIYSELELAAKLEDGVSFLLIGQPTDGKTRTLFQIAKRLREFIIIRPNPHADITEDSLRSLKKKKVLLVLDDLNDYENARINILDFYHTINSVTSLCAIVASCREGRELTNLRVTTTSPLQKVYEFLALKLVLRPVSDADKERLKVAIGESGRYPFPTLGAICMRGAFVLMRERFAALPASTQDCFRALQLLSEFEVTPLTQLRLRGVLATVFQRPTGEPAILRDQLNELANSGFILSSGHADPIRTEDAFIAGPEAAFYYGERNSREDDPLNLGLCLLDLKDAAGLNRLALWFYNRDNPGGAIVIFNAVLQSFFVETNSLFRFETAFAFRGAATLLGEQHEHDQAVSCYDEMFENFAEAPEAAIREQVAMAIRNKAFMLKQQSKFREAVACYDEVDRRYAEAPEVEIQVQVITALGDKGVLLNGQGQRELALGCYDEIERRHAQTSQPEIRPLVAAALLEKATVLFAQDKHDEAVACWREICHRFGKAPEPTIRECVAKALWEMASALSKQGRFEEALDVYGELDRRFENAQQITVRRMASIALQGKAAISVDLGRLDEAIACFDEIYRRHALDPDELLLRIAALALGSKADLLLEQGKYQAAVTCCDEISDAFGHSTEAQTCNVVIAALDMKAGAVSKRGMIWRFTAWLRSYIVRAGARRRVARGSPNRASVIGG